MIDAFFFKFYIPSLKSLLFVILNFVMICDLVRSVIRMKGIGGSEYKRRYVYEEIKQIGKDSYLRGIVYMQNFYH